jgi:hypothetical protein
MSAVFLAPCAHGQRLQVLRYRVALLTGPGAHQEHQPTLRGDQEPSSGGHRVAAGRFDAATCRAGSMGRQQWGGRDAWCRWRAPPWAARGHAR